MAKAVQCPICNGAGKLKDPGKNMDATYAPEKICHGCSGKGWVEVSEEFSQKSPQYIPSINPWPFFGPYSGYPYYLGYPGAGG